MNSTSSPSRTDKISNNCISRLLREARSCFVKKQGDASGSLRGLNGKIFNYIEILLFAFTSHSLAQCLLHQFAMQTK